MDVNAAGTLTTTAGECVSIGILYGTRAIGKASKGEDMPPSVLLEYEFLFDRDVWLFLGEQCGAVATVSLVRRQGTLVDLGARKGASA